MLRNVFETFVNLLESCIIIHFICAFLGLDFRTARGRLIFMTGVLLDFICVTIINSLREFDGAMGLIYIAVYFLLSGNNV